MCSSNELKYPLKKVSTFKALCIGVAKTDHLLYNWCHVQLGLVLALAFPIFSLKETNYWVVLFQSHVICYLTYDGDLIGHIYSSFNR